MASVRIVRDKNGVLRGALPDDHQGLLDCVDAFQSDLAALKIPDYSADLAALFADMRTEDSFSRRFVEGFFRGGRPTRGTGHDEDGGEKRRRELEIKADFFTFVAEPAKLKFPVCGVSPELRAALIADLAEGGSLFRWISGENPWRAIGDEISTRVGLSSTEPGEQFYTISGGFESIIPRHELQRRLFGMMVGFIRDGRLLAFGERHGRPIHLEGSLFEDGQFRVPGFAGSSWIDRIKVFSPLRFIGAKDAFDQFSGRLGPRSRAAVCAEERAKMAIRQLAAAHPGARMIKDDAVAGLKTCGFGLRARDRIWDGAALDAWKKGRRPPSGVRRLSSDDLVAVLKQLL